MARLNEQELYCPECNSVREYPQCCGKEMEYDGEVFFCNICNKEVKPFFCCGKEMVSRQIVRDIRKELFSDF